MSPLDLHVLSTPPAFVLSQDQTLMFNPLSSFAVSSLRLAKALNLLQQIRRLLSQKSDCSFLLIYFAVSFSRIAVVVVNRCSRDNVEYYSKG